MIKIKNSLTIDNIKAQVSHLTRIPQKEFTLWAGNKILYGNDRIS